MMFEGFHFLGEIHAFSIIEQHCYETRGELDTLERLGEMHILQWTGLQDNEKKDIYECDVLKYVYNDDESSPEYFEVRFIDGAFYSGVGDDWELLSEDLKLTTDGHTKITVHSDVFEKSWRL